MKTRVFSIFLIAGLSFLFATNVVAQTRQNKTALSQVEAEIRSLESQSSAVDTLKLQSRINQLNARLATLLPVEQAAAIREQIKVYQTQMSENQLKIEDNAYRLEELKVQRQILRNKTTTAAIQEKTPKELRNTETKRRFNSFSVRSGEVCVSKQELSLQKLTDTHVNTGSGSELGYKVIIWNQDTRRSGNFKLTDLSGQDIDGATVFLSPGQKVIKYLLPGEYLGTVQMYGRSTGTVRVPVEIREKEVYGEKCHGYLIQTSR